MRHGEVQTTMTYYVAIDADEVAADLWRDWKPEAGNILGNSGQESVGSESGGEATKPLRGK